MCTPDFRPEEWYAPEAEPARSVPALSSEGDQVARVRQRLAGLSVKMARLGETARLTTM